MRLLDRLSPGTGSARFNPELASGAAVIVSAFGTPDAEKVLPTWRNHLSAYTESVPVFAAIQRRLELFSEAEFALQNLKTRKLDRTAPELALLRTPWRGGTTAELLARMLQDADLMGNSFTRRGDELQRLRPDCVTIVSEITVDSTGEEIRTVIGYLYEPPPMEQREVAFYPVEEVAHWAPIPDPEANFRGMTWMTPVLREVDADRRMTDYKRAYLENAATPNLVIRYKHKVGQNKINALREQIDARHAGADKAFRTLALDEGADLTTVGNNFEEMRFEQVQAAGENRIAVASGVPAIVMGLKEGLSAATYSNFKQAMRAFADLAMRPLWRKACSALAVLLELPEGSRLWFDTSDIAALQEGEKERADIMQVNATAASTLISAGYTPESAIEAINANDMGLLKHTGLISVQLQPPGAGAPPAAPGAPAKPPTPPGPDDPDDGGDPVDPDDGEED